MGNSGLLSCGKEFDSNSLLCRRTCGLDELHLDTYRCDPCGVVFDDTVQSLAAQDQLGFKFSGSSNLAALRWLFLFGANHLVTDTNGTTLLHVACRTGSLGIVKDLVKRGLPIDVVDNAGWTPLHVASCMGRQDVSLLLLRHGASATAKNARGQTPEELCSHPWTKEVVVTYDSRTQARPSQIGLPMRPASSDAPEHYGIPGNITEIQGSLHFEPFFVPRDALLHEPRHREELQKVGTWLFNQSAGHGIAFLVASGAVRDYPVEINNFLVRVKADPAGISDYLGEEFPISQTMRLEFLNSLPLLGTGVVSALETAFQEMAVPSDWLKADRLTRGIAHFWWRQHAEESHETADAFGQPPREPQLAGRAGEVAGVHLQRSLLSSAALHRLMFSALKLHQWLRQGNKMSLGEWVQINSGIECNGNDIPMQVHTGIYRALSDTRVALNRRTVAQNPDNKVTLEGKAYIHFEGRAQVGSGADTAAWAGASPRLLAAEGGAPSAGRSFPMPGPMPSDAVPQVVDDDAVLPRAKQTSGQRGEIAWLRLYGWILLLSGNAPGATPYAFVSLRQSVLKEANSTQKRLVLASQEHGNWPPAGASERSWLDLCLLLGDGRFQLLEAPYLELQFTSESDYNAWCENLVKVCLPSPEKEQVSIAETRSPPPFLCGAAQQKPQPKVTVEPVVPPEQDETIIMA